MTAHTPTPDPALHLRADGISFSYPGQAADRRVLTDVSLVVPAGRQAAWATSRSPCRT